MKYTFLLLIPVVFSCTDMDKVCKEAEKKIQKDYCNIVVDNIKKQTLILEIEGVNPVSQKPSSYEDYTRQFQGVIKYTEKGDTVVKKEGELKLYVYKKDSIIICNVQDFCKKINDPNSDYLTFIKR
ncbi:hypothetical protein [Empedobacter brevis]|uniref:hypothetical protein n=1 Tax=Empedobacter brevis TaxID=247 RepID=UPI0028D702DB|nr:hypothetical protein [Empedobacter brevis]